MVRGEVLIEDTNVSLPNKWLGIWRNLRNMKVAPCDQLNKNCIVLSRNPTFSSEFNFLKGAFLLLLFGLALATLHPPTTRSFENTMQRHLRTSYTNLTYLTLPNLT